MAARTTVTKLYFCDCDVYCHSRRKQVSRSTYQRHAPYRQNPGQFGVHNMMSGRRREVDLGSSNRASEVQAQEANSQVSKHQYFMY